MAHKSTFLLCVFLAVASAASFAPLELLDQAREEVQDLFNIVEGQIIGANDLLDYLLSEFRGYSLNVVNAGAYEIQHEQETIDANLQATKDLADAAGYDISSCRNIREQALNRLPQRLTDQLNACVSNVESQATTTSNDGRYIVNIIINTVHNLDFQVRQCGQDLLCIEPLLTKIEQNKIGLAKNVRTETQGIEDLLANLMLSIQTCSDSKVAQYVSEASGILNDIQRCADRIMGN